jgi:hypothetical protein
MKKIIQSGLTHIETLMDTKSDLEPVTYSKSINPVEFGNPDL